MSVAARYIRAFEGPNLFGEVPACVACFGVDAENAAEVERFLRAIEELLKAGNFRGQLRVDRDESRARINLILTGCNPKGAALLVKQAIDAYSPEQSLVALPVSIVDKLCFGVPARFQPRGFPIVSVTGTNGKTTVVRLLSHLLSESGHRVGMATSGGIHIVGELIYSGDTTGPKSARRILAHEKLSVAVLETARGGIIRRGLGFEWCDVGIITNVQLDHIGQDGIETLDDILAIKTLVAKRVRPGGTLILNADDDRVASLSPWNEAGSRKIVLFSLSSENLRVRAHCSGGGTAYFERDRQLWGRTGEAEISFGNSASAPITQHGNAKFHVSNILAAIAAARELAVSPAKITGALASFDANRDNPGRGNLFRVANGFVMVDYGHNPEAFRAVGNMLRQWPGIRKTAVVGLPGDRSDEVVRSCASALGEYFDKIVIREDRNTRGRPPGEVPNLMLEHLEKDFPATDASMTPTEEAAVEKALREMEDGEILVVFYDDDPVRVRDHIVARGGDPCALLPKPL